MRGVLPGIILMAVFATAAAAQVPAFDDVPPWHWAFDAIQKTVPAGMFVGYPRSDTEAVINAITQVYEAFAHAAHPQARDWADRFLTGTPSNWPQPLTASRVLGFRLERPQPALSGERGTVTVIAVVVLRQDRSSTEIRSRVRADLQRDSEGRWRVDYRSLSSAQPQVFK